MEVQELPDRKSHFFFTATKGALTLSRSPECPQGCGWLQVGWQNRANRPPWHLGRAEAILPAMLSTAASPGCGLRAPACRSARFGSQWVFADTVGTGALKNVSHSQHFSVQSAQCSQQRLNFGWVHLLHFRMTAKINEKKRRNKSNKRKIN